MPTYLVTLALGPVQSLIAAARRTRDLWCGSWLLSEAARAAARVLHQQAPGCLIFPHLANPDQDLVPQEHIRDDDANIANILRAILPLPDAEAVRALCERAQQAAAVRIHALGEEARRNLPSGLRDDVWGAQIHDILESFAAWVEVASAADYPRQSEQLGSVLAARKATRDFEACQPVEFGLPKSSLDGALETVLPEWCERHRARRKLGLSDGERLDTLGLIKRLAGESEQFTAYTRIAADSWLETLLASQLAQLREVYEPLVGLELATRVQGNQGSYKNFPYDGGLLFDFRLANALSKAHLDQDAEASDAITLLQRTLKNLAQERNRWGEQVGNPVPYAAVLLADGDRMGKLLTQAKTAQDSQRISRDLHGFACQVRAIVRKHRGHAIYAGGDDVLALVPLQSAQACAKALADAFKQDLRAVATDLGVADAEQPTLSVGIGIGHIIEPFWSLRDRAERAEKLAKGNSLPESQQRNALAIQLGIRSGGELRWRTQWGDSVALEDLASFTQAFANEELPSRVAYDLRAIDLRLAWLREEKTEMAQGMRNAELLRMLDRARAQGQKINEDLHKRLVKRARQQGLNTLADMLILARWLSARTASDLEGRG